MKMVAVADGVTAGSMPDQNNSARFAEAGIDSPNLAPIFGFGSNAQD